jgi:hypothetical protein
MTRFVCPHCKKLLAIDERTAGRVAACPACGGPLRLPTASRPVAVPAQPAGPRPVATPVARPAGDADEDEAKLRAELPDAFFPGSEKLGRPRYRVERQVFDHKAYNPVAALVLCCIPCFIGAIVPGVYLLPRLLCILFIAAFLAGAVKFIQWQRRRANVHAVVWTDGFVHFDGREYHVWRWSDVAVLNRKDVDQRTLVLFIETDRILATHYRLRHRDGTVYQFWNTQGQGAGRFGSLIEQETFRIIMPDVLARLENGESIWFSPFEVKADGLVYRGQFLEWADLRSARFERGRLILEGAGPAGGTVSVLLWKIDNPHVFLKLLEQNMGFADD